MAGVHVEFTEFWDAYGLKRDRMSADRVWRRMSQKDRRAALAGISAYRETCRTSGIAMAYPAKYLSHRRWEDVADAAVQEPASPPKAPRKMETW